MLLFILDKRLEVVDTLSNEGDLHRITPYFDDEYCQYLETGAETFSFSTMASTSESEHLVVGNYIAFMYNREVKLFHITECEEVHGQEFVKTVYCEMAGIELANEIIRPMKVNSVSVSRFLDSILAQTGWKRGFVDSGITEVYDFEITNYESVYSVIQEHIVGTFGAEISFTCGLRGGKVVDKYVNVYKKRGKNEGYRFEYSSNLSSVAKTSDSSNLATALIGIGKNNITFSDIEAPDKPLNQDFIADEQAYRRWNINGSHIMGVFQSDTESKQELLLLTRKELDKRKNPNIKYELKTEVLDYEDVEIGDTIKAADHEFNPPIYLEARINELKISFTDRSKNECVLANYKEIQSKIDKFSTDGIIKDLKDYLDTLSTGILSQTVINNLKSYLQRLALTKEEIDYIFKSVVGNASLDTIKGEHLDIVMKSGKIYMCETLKTLTIKLPTTVAKDYESKIIFRTPKDTEPIIFDQTNTVWLTGSDCINGALLPKADTTYQITVKPGTDKDEGRRYSGKVISEYHGGSYKPFTNYKGGEKIVEIGATWYEVRDNFTYKTTTPLSPFAPPNTDPAHPDNLHKWKNPDTGIMNIDCSTFTNHLFKCRTYKQSIYANLKNGIGVNTKFSYATDLGRLAATQAQTCVRNGWILHEVKGESDWHKLKPGDLVFWSSRTEDEGRNEIVADRFMQVGHVAVIKGFNDNGDVHTYEVTNLNHTIRNRLLKDNYPEKILFFARVRKG